MAVKNVILDIGNVLTDFRWKEFLVDKGYSPEMIKRIAKASVGTPYWDEFDKGTITEEEALEVFSSYDPEISEELYKAFHNIEEMVTPREYAVPWVKEMKEMGLKVYYLSNFSKKAFDECKPALEFVEYTDGGIMSFQEYITKPNPIIYKRLLKRYDLVAEECLFFDDTQVNVDAAIACGYQSVLFTTLEQAKEDLKARL